MSDTKKIPGGTIEREALKAEVARLEADNTAIGEDQEAMSKQLAEAESHADDLNVLVLEQADKITLLRAVGEAAENHPFTIIDIDSVPDEELATAIKAAREGGALE